VPGLRPPHALANGAVEISGTSLTAAPSGMLGDGAPNVSAADDSHVHAGFHVRRHLPPVRPGSGSTDGPLR